MKTKMTLSIAIFIFFSIILRSQPIFPLTGYEDNPTVTATESWESGGLMFPFVYYEADTFYLFYTAGDMETGPTVIGLATSTDGYNFTQKDSIFGGDESGFDAYSVCLPVVIKKDETYYLFYAGASDEGFCSDGITGQATASSIYGPYERLDDPILEKGSTGEWDDMGVAPDQVFETDSGFVMYFTGTIWNAYPEQEGLAHYNGSEWVKYDNPTTTSPPFAESDPVLKYGSPGSWDEWCASMLTVNELSSGWEMIFQAGKSDYSWRFGYATSTDGIEWEKWEDPVYSYLDDPFAQLWGFTVTASPTMVVVDNTYYIYYDYGNGIGNNYLGMATAESVISSQNNILTSDVLQIVTPNPFKNEITVEFHLQESGLVESSIVNINGQQLDSFIFGHLKKGNHKRLLNTNSIPSGVYFCILKTASGIQSTKIIKL